jgi:hypothetical protein
MNGTHLHLVSDPTDDIEHVHLVESLIGEDEGLILVRLTPGGESKSSLHADVAGGLGRRISHQMASGSVEGWLHNVAWLIADEIEDIVVLRAHQLQVDQCECLIGLANLCGANLWLLAQMDPLPPMMTDALTFWPIDSVSAAEMHNRLRQSANRRQNHRHNKLAASRAVAHRFEVPEDEFYTFWDSAHKTLDPDELDAFDRIFDDGITRTRSWLRSNASIDEESVAAYLRALISEAVDRNVALTLLRSAQAVLFESWILIKASFDQLNDSLFFSNPPMGLTHEAVSRLRLIANASDAALATIALATPFELAEMHALRFENVALDGSSVVTGDTKYEIPDYATRFIKAHRLVRLFKGTSPGENLFNLSTGDNDNDLSLARIRGRLSAVSRHTGLFFAGQWMRREAETSQRWIGRQGISVQLLMPPTEV